MKQDILIFSSCAEHVKPVCTVLARHDIPATVVDDKQDALLALISHTPAFLWIDMDADAARAFLAEMMDKFLHPPPYVILTSTFSDSTDRANLLDHGADACIELPVDQSEILAILNAVLRREERLRFFRTINLCPCIEHKEMYIDPLRREVKMRGQAIGLTPKEFDILHLLANSPGVVFAKEEIYARIWQVKEGVVASSVTEHISSLRQKLGLHPKDSEYIQTVFKVGYRFAEIK